MELEPFLLGIKWWGEVGVIIFQVTYTHIQTETRSEL